jgi:hypothetical protein
MLKKCVVIMVMFALVAGVSFAQMSFGGQLQTSAVLFGGNNVTDSDLTMGGAYNGTYTNVKYSATIGDGTAGGRIMFDSLNSGGRFWGWMQWRPSQYFRIKVGSDEDGDSVIGGFPQIVGWGFTGEAKNSAAVSDYNGSLAMNYRNSGLNYGAFDNSSGFSLGLSFFPVDALTLSLLFKGNFQEAVEISERFATMHFVAKYVIEEIGVIRFAWEGQGGLRTDAPDGSKIGQIHLAFFSSDLVQGLAFEAGGTIPLPTLNDADTVDAIRVSLGVNLTTLTDPFNFKLRVGSMFGGKSGGVDNEKVGISVGILPSYKLAKATIFFHAGLGIEQDNKDAEATTNWFINPYVWVPMGGMRMWVGLQIIDEGKRQEDDAAQLTWRIPFGFNFYF